MARRSARRYASSSLTDDRPTTVDPRSSRAGSPESHSTIVARDRYRGREIRVFVARRGYYVEAEGITHVPGPFDTIPAAIERGRILLDPARYAAFTRRARKGRKAASRRPRRR
jgi:hypothetical protein